MAITGIGESGDSGSSEGVRQALLKNENMMEWQGESVVVENYFLPCSVKLFIYALFPHHKSGRFRENSFNHVSQYFTR